MRPSQLSSHFPPQCKESRITLHHDFRQTKHFSSFSNSHELFIRTNFHFISEREVFPRLRCAVVNMTNFTMQKAVKSSENFLRINTSEQFTWNTWRNIFPLTKLSLMQLIKLLIDSASGKHEATLVCSTT